MTTSSSRSVLLVIGGGIAAYKTLELIRLLKTRGIAVRAILTKGGEQFVTPLSVAALTGGKVHSDLFSLTDEAEMGHIELSRAADLVVVAPATADLMAKLAGGLANDLASTALLATDKPVLLAPAMNVRMWLHPATQRNLAQLMADGVRVVGPDEGDMACGEFGPGRMAEPAAIALAIEEALSPAGGMKLLTGAAPRPLKGRKVLITAGPTREAIDPVRYISNHSSGKQGYAIAAAAVVLGAEVVLVSGPTALPIPPGVQMVPVESAAQMMAAVSRELPADIAIFTAAVADWRGGGGGGGKNKKGGKAAPTITLAENPDILKTVATLKAGRPLLVVGFAAETENVVAHARDKLSRKGADLIVANDVSPAGGVFGGDRNMVHLIARDGVEDWPDLSKAEVARRLMDRLASLLAARV